MTLTVAPHRAYLRKITFLALNLLVGSCLLALIVVPARDFFVERDARIAERGAVLARLSALVARGPDVEAAAVAMAEEESRGELLIGSNDGVINADLQTRLKATAEQAGARVRSVQGLPVRTVKQMRMIGARLEIFGTHRAIRSVSHAIESGLPYLFVTAATLRPSPPLHGPSARDEPMIEARLDVLGAIRVEARAP